MRTVDSAENPFKYANEKVVARREGCSATPTRAGLTLNASKHERLEVDEY